MKRNIIIYSILWLVSVVVLYLLMSLVELSVNPHKWTFNARASFGLFVFVLAIASAVLTDSVFKKSK